MRHIPPRTIICAMVDKWSLAFVCGGLRYRPFTGVRFRRTSVSALPFCAPPSGLRYFRRHSVSAVHYCSFPMGFANVRFRRYTRVHRFAWSVLAETELLRWLWQRIGPAFLSLHLRFIPFRSSPCSCAPFRSAAQPIPSLHTRCWGGLAAWAGCDRRLHMILSVQRRPSCAPSRLAAQPAPLLLIRGAGAVWRPGRDVIVAPT